MRHSVELCLLGLVGFFLLAVGPSPDPHGQSHGPWPELLAWVGPFPDPNG
jgi:hypothetical protein